MHTRIIPLILMALALYGCGQTAGDNGPVAIPGDADGDGHTIEAGDCDDSNALINPAATEECDEVDNNCDGVVDEGADADADGFKSCSEAAGPLDCDDANPDAYPGAEEIPYDGIDQNCDGVDLSDLDYDGWDGVEAGGQDCDDEDETRNPSAAEIAYDGIDQDCDGADLIDVDGDGYAGPEGGGDDCDDSRVSVNPAGNEIIDGLDNDCDGAVDRVVLTEAQASWIGEYATDRAGASLAEVGDINGDGITDIAFGAPGADGTAADSGKVYLIFGTSEPSSGELDLSYADVTLVGVSAGERAGTAIAGIGDLNGDGIGDLALVAPGSEEGWDLGHIYLVWGRSSGWPTRMSLADADGVISGVSPGDALGAVVAGARDFDGDTLPDLVIGLPSFDDPGLGSAGSLLDCGAVAIFRGVSPVTDSEEAEGDGGGDEMSWFVDLMAADQLWLGESDEAFAGAALGAVGDLTGDGRSDLVIGAPGMESEESGQTGGAYLLFGRAEARDVAPSLAGADVRFVGDREGDLAGAALAAGRDVNADGWPDLVVGAPGVSSGAGAVYIFLGKPSGLAASLTIDDADAIWSASAPGMGAGAAVAFGVPGSADAQVGLWVGLPGMAGPVGEDGFPGEGAVALLPTESVVSGGDVETASMIVFGMGEEGMGTVIAEVSPRSESDPGCVLVGLPGDARGGEEGGAAALLRAP